jgi:hypothetical protein
LTPYDNGEGGVAFAGTPVNWFRDLVIQAFFEMLPQQLT